MKNLNKAEKIAFLKLSPLFQDLSKRQLGLIAQKSYQETVKAGRTIIKQGAIGKQFSVIADGVVRVEKDKKFIRSMSQGAYFGEISLFDGRPMSATVVAETEVHLLCVNKTSFRKLMDSVPGLKDKLILSLCKYIRSSDELMDKLRETIERHLGQSS